ncbi:MAG: hypothetical protein U5N58_07435 [Actinomycetota bacterium]|nr:hypothetical protein [Actinomycetota bacterium]
MSLMDEYFGSHNYSLWHLFKDKQREIISMVTRPALKEIEQQYRQIYDHNYPVMQAMNQMNIPLPETFSNVLKFIFNTDLQKIMADRKAKTKKLRQLVEEIGRWPIKPDQQVIGYVASKTIKQMMRKLYETPRDKLLLSTIKNLLQILEPLNLDYDLWEAQNLYFYISRDIYPRWLKLQKAVMPMPGNGFRILNSLTSICPQGACNDCCYLQDSVLAGFYFLPRTKNCRLPQAAGNRYPVCLPGFRVPLSGQQL